MKTFNSVLNLNNFVSIYSVIKLSFKVSNNSSQGIYMIRKSTKQNISHMFFLQSPLTPSITWILIKIFSMSCIKSLPQPQNVYKAAFPHSQTNFFHAIPQILYTTYMYSYCRIQSSATFTCLSIFSLLIISRFFFKSNQ